MKFPGNCLVVAYAIWLRHPRTTRIRFVRTNTGRWHCVWERYGRLYDFYAPQRSRFPYWRNAVYLGAVREIPRGLP